MSIGNHQYFFFEKKSPNKQKILFFFNHFCRRNAPIDPLVFRNLWDFFHDVESYDMVCISIDGMRW